MTPPLPPVGVLDAGSVIALLADERGADVVEAWLSDPARACCIHALNLCEVFYHFVRAAGEATAQEAVRELAAHGLTVREDMDADFWQSAARLKASLVRVSLADCCGLAPCPVTFAR